MPASRRRSAVHEPRYQYLLQLIREARKEAGLTQKDVAKALGRPLSFVSKLELGERRMDPVDLEELAQLYNKPITYFYSWPRRRAATRA